MWKTILAVGCGRMRGDDSNSLASLCLGRAWKVCIYGWDPRLRSVLILQKVMDRPNWNIGALFGGLTAERVGARHDDFLHNWSS